MSTRKLRDGLAAGIKDRAATETVARNRFDRADEALALENEPTSSRVLPKPGDAREHAPAAVDLASARVVREIFSMPAPDSVLLEVLRERCKATGTFVSKSELVRAGLHALAALPNDDVVALVGSLEKRRPGRRRSAKR